MKTELEIREEFVQNSNQTYAMLQLELEELRQMQYYDERPLGRDKRRKRPEIGKKLTAIRAF